MALTVMMTGSMMSAAAENDFKYADERFADLQMLRYKVPGFENLSLKQKTFIYYLQEAALWGRDILWDQNCRYNLRVRRVLEEVYKQEMRFRTGNEDDKEEFQAFLIKTPHELLYIPCWYSICKPQPCCYQAYML